MSQEALVKVIESYGASEATPMEMYTDVFRLGENLIQRSGEPSGFFKTNPILVRHNGQYAQKRVMFEDKFEDILAESQEYEWAIISGVTYWGKNNLAANQSKMYALIFDLDGVTEKTLDNFFRGATTDFYPMPNYIVTSGHGVHLYYIMEEPISLYPNIKTQLKQFKYALTDVIWNKLTSTDRKIQHQPINQGYRIPGGKTKVNGIRARAFLVNAHPTNLDELNEFVDEKHQVDVTKLYKESRISREEARELYPDWYERVVVNGEPPRTWTNNRGLYDWWKSEIFDNATFGHRYYCVMALAIYAIKCGISEEEVRNDALSFMVLLNTLNPQEPFTESDVESALECYDERYKTFPRSSIEYLTGIPIPTNKRNGQDRHTHLQADYWEIDGEVIENPCKKNREAGWAKALEEGLITGRPKGSGTKKASVERYYRDHPETTVREAAENLGISSSTVQRWKPK
ncbi:helix-turn-helix domain-containing protein [Slackia piriformis]|uniref:helix-turn-helix domain-containing protein n=1 Tax=Slackia piriformis TaxID=626934 RepID=UPI0023F10DE2|nr:helix-turn-helix domain-containing protein [Slackia piriformis]